MSRSALLASALVAALLQGCQSASSIPSQSALEQLAMQNAMTTSKPRAMSEAQRDKALGDAQCAQNMAPVVGGANMLGGLDPTGLTQSTVQSAAMRCAAKVQANMPALIEDSRSYLNEYCTAHPKLQTCIDHRALEAKAKAMGLRR